LILYFLNALFLGVRESYVNLCSNVDDKLKIYRENFERAYILATESFYKIQARPCSVFTNRRILSPRTGTQYIILNGTVRTILRYRDQFERAYILATESFYKIQARPAAVFTWRILSKVQLGLVFGTEINLSVHSSLPQSLSIKYRQGPVAVFSGRILSRRTSFYKVQLGLVCGKFGRVFILATESFYKIQARLVPVFTGRIFCLHLSIKYS
jgi:hypothetical protein